MEIIVRAPAHLVFPSPEERHSLYQYVDTVEGKVPDEEWHTLEEAVITVDFGPLGCRALPRKEVTCILKTT